MRAAQLTGEPHQLELTTVDTPQPGDGEVLLRVEGCGICGSDLHISGLGLAGVVMGHEIAGTVAELGPGVDPSVCAMGSAVSVKPTVGCHHCVWCQKGRPDHCEHFQLIGLERFGGFAEYVAAPVADLYRLPATISGAEQALVEPLAVARQTLRRADLAPGEDVLVIGGGPIGLAVTAWARTLGAGRIVVSEPVERRRMLAATLGADHTVDPIRDDLGEAVAEHLDGSPPVVIEASGAPGRLDEALLHAGRRGRVAVVAILFTPDQIVPWTALQKELDVRFAMYYDPVDFTDTIDALDQHRLAAADMITDTIGLDELPDRFSQMAESPDVGKVVVAPG
ncbi:MAG: alcohol dehydrogenase catalytic domain-containing protein [Acidimicrobiia bacterium]|nr:alcohol dehydrogenase catalytic domain-containing protein [Acidimicrobiia bacterium]